MFRKFGNAVMVPAMFFLSFYLLGTTGWAQGQGLLGTPPPGVFRIGGTVTTIGGLQLIHDDNDAGYTFVVTGEDGKPFISANGDKSEDTDGLNDHHYYVIDIPIYDAVTQPDGKQTDETARLHVYENGLELSFRSTPDTYEFTTVEGGTAKENPIIVSPVLYVTPHIRMVAEPKGTMTFKVIKAGLDAVSWTAELSDNPCLTIIGNDYGTDDGTITIEYDFMEDACNGANGKEILEISGYLTSDKRRIIPVKPQTVIINRIDLQDAIVVLKLLTESSATTPSDASKPLAEIADVNGDNRIGLEEAIYILEYLSGKRG